MNFIVILADDLGWADVSYNGGEIHTPVIDDLCKNGIKLNQFYAQPICTPTRAAIMTGRYPFRYGIQQIVWPWNHHGLPLSEKLISQFFKEAGYETHALGKWNLGHVTKQYFPNERGFDSFYGAYTGSTDHWSHTYFKIHDFHYNGSPIYPKGHTTDLCTARTIELINSATKPFFIYLAFTAPHVPLQTFTHFLEQNKHIKDVTRRTYAGMVCHMDKSIGKIVNALKSKNIFDETLIWFMSDNGGWAGTGSSNGLWRGGKISTYEGGKTAS